MKNPCMKISFILAICLFASIAVKTQTIRRVDYYSPPGVTNNVGSFEVAVVHSTGLVYNSSSNYGGEIGVIDPDTNSLIANVPLSAANGFNGGSAAFSRVNQSTNILYFLINNSIVVIDGRPESPTFNQSLRGITFAGQTISAFAIDQTRQVLYVSTRTTGSSPLQSQIQIVDVNPASATFNQNLATQLLPPQPSGQQALGIAVNAVTNKVYVATNLAGGGVYVINYTTGNLTLIAGTSGAASLAVNEKTNLIYVGGINNGVAFVGIVDGTNDTLITTVSVPNFNAFSLTSEGFAVNQTTNRIYLVGTDSVLRVLDGNRASPTFNQIIASIANVGSGRIALDEFTNKIVVTSFNLKTTIVDGATNTIAATIFGGLSSTDVVVDPVTHRAFVTYQLQTTLVINLNDNSFTNIATAAEVGVPILNPNNNTLYVPRTRATTEIAFYNPNDSVGLVTGQPTNLGRYIFTAQNTQTNRIYVANSSANATGTDRAPGFVSVIDGATNNIIANVDVGGQPFGITVNEATNKIYVLNAGFGSTSGFPSNITVIDGATNTVSNVDTSAFPANTSFLRDLAVNPVTNRIYFEVGDGASVGVINGATNVATPIPGITGVSNIFVNRNLNRVYFFSATSLRVLNGADDSVIATIPLSAASNLAINQTTGRIFVTSFTNKTLTAIDGTSNTIVGTIALANSPSSIAVNEITNRVYVGNPNFNNESASSISFIDGNSLAVKRTLPLPIVPSRIIVNPATQTVYVTNVVSSVQTGLAIISDTSAAPFDFDGDEKSDLSVFRPSNGTWFINPSRNANTFYGVQFGVSTDKIVPADYDGDGKTDVAVYRDGVWYILQSSDNKFRAVSFGLPDDLPRPGDFDGDGRAEIAVWRPSNGFWYYLQSSNNQFRSVQLGQSGDAPVLGDYDGDGRTDFTVFRPSVGTWFILRSLDAQIQISQFGQSGDIPVSGDFGGDGKTDLAVYRPSNGFWYIARPTGAPAQNFDSVQFGASSDTPVPADYDGDGKTDIAVYRAKEGNWYQLKSTSGFSSIQFGLSTDKPIPSAFLP